MPSAINTRHSKQNTETNAKSFLFDAKIIPQDAVNDGVNAVSNFECLTHTQPKKSLERACLELFGSHDVCTMEADKATWHDDVMSYQQYKKEAIGSDYKMYLLIMHPFMRDRTKGTPRLEQWQRHNSSDLTIIVRPSQKRKRTRWIAFDIDTPISEQELLQELERVQDLHNVVFTYCRSTSGRAWHLWIFTAEHFHVSVMRDAALKIEASLNIEICQTYPNGNQQITAAFAAHRPLKTTAGRTIAHPAHLPFNDAAINSLNKAGIKPPKTKRNGTQANTANKKTPKPRKNAWLDDVPLEKQATMHTAYCKGLEIYLQAFRENYPHTQEHRQSYVLASAADFVALNISKADAKELVKDAAAGAGDKDTAQRFVAVERTYKKAFAGDFIRGFSNGIASDSASAKIREAYFYSNLNEYEKELRPLIAEQRLVTVIELRTPVNTGSLYTAGRVLADNTGMSEGTVRAARKRLEKRGVIAVYKLPKKQGTQYKLLKGYEAYVVSPEQRETATDKNVVRVNKNKKRHQQESKKDRENTQHTTVTALPRNEAQKHDTDTNVIESDDSQNNVKAPSEVDVSVLIVADGDYAPKPLDTTEDYAEAPAMLANAPPMQT